MWLAPTRGADTVNHIVSLGHSETKEKTLSKKYIFKEGSILPWPIPQLPAIANSSISPKPNCHLCGEEADSTRQTASASKFGRNWPPLAAGEYP